MSPFKSLSHSIWDSGKFLGLYKYGPKVNNICMIGSSHYNIKVLWISLAASILQSFISHCLVFSVFSF